ncbi:DEAD/DEAH box helicase family protein [Reinekea marinisedimentorum]|uniref:Superfamily II DNA or RNA helicase n=1 Tax=Reinekea marinisedimentorum TaxID=230495 RepID=A0A4R3I4A4_9GAMM|nr:DEAD/DEAH box helicase family protein [Reinekea marinisedimentorum]TCS40420.1 superfamily II DNA or RNA helicase [Reinekea marinisedimentorum]
MNQKSNPLSYGSKLTTGGEDQLLEKLVHAINRANEIFISVSFIQKSGIRLLFEALSDALQRNASIKLVSSDYMCITDPTALRDLQLLQQSGAQVKMFVCKGRQSFHMKSYIFVRNEDDTEYNGCAFVGSNNISEAALTSAIEWCLRYDQNTKEPEFKNILNQFDAVFNHSQTVELTDHWISNYIERRSEVKPALQQVGAIDEPKAVPNNAQLEALTALQGSRDKGFKRGLVVLATGMGKTWLSAFDVQQLGAKTVLFVAHREEILTQAARTFTQLMPEQTTGFYNGKQKQQESDFLFASVQTIGQQSHLEQFSAEHFDYIIVDEFHHATANTYRQLLNHFKPKFLLGLTATPERTDQADIIQLCDNNRVFERTLINGIEDKILVPFHYYGINDETVDYQALPWRNGRFDPNEATNAFATNKRATHITEHWHKHHQQRTLAFCISKRHADFMASWFNKEGIPSAAVYSGSTLHRNEALEQLNRGKLSVLFSVDLFNEGTDLPAIDTVLILRPTESKILFLQQLGRGLRQSPETDKTHLVVLDFIGNHKSYLNRAMALLGKNHPSATEINKLKKTPELTDGCFVNIAPELIDFWADLVRMGKTAIQAYQSLSEYLGRRPSASEFFYDGFKLTKMREQQGSWFELVANQEDDAKIQKITRNPVYRNFLLQGIETTSMAKSFKPILLEAFLELDGLRTPPTTEALAQRSREIFDRHPELLPDIRADLQNCSSTDSRWHKYWLSNPINFLSKKDQNHSQAWFTVEHGVFKANINIDAAHINVLERMMQELVELLLALYSDRISRKKEKDKPQVEAKQPESNVVQLPYFPNLKIACGHFKNGTADEAELMEIPTDYNRKDNSRLFLARASGNSMNGGKNPIQDGDLLLLERITSNNAGSISNLTMAIERQDEGGDNQYLLRVVKKNSDGSYRLVANNPEYGDLIANEGMATFARLVGVVG